MGVRKIAVSAVMMGALGAAGLGLAGGASADTQCHYNCPKPASQTTTITKTSNVSASGQFGVGNVTQSAGAFSGAISNPQLGVAVSLPVSANLPIQVSPNVLAQKGVGSDQYSRQRVVSVAKANESYNSTAVNTAVENGAGSSSSVKIGNVN